MTDTPSPEDRLVGLFDRLRKLAFNQHPLENSTVTMPQLTLLDWVAASPGCGIQDIAAGLSLTAPTVSVGVRRLEKAGLLERRSDPQDLCAVPGLLPDSGERREMEGTKACPKQEPRSGADIYLAAEAWPEHV